MPVKEVETPYPRIDSDPHFTRVVKYFRPTDYALWAGTTAAFPAAIYFWEMADPVFNTNIKNPLRTPMRLGGLLGCIGGFLLAYQTSSTRFWGWSENSREIEMDKQELTQRAKEGKPLYGTSNQPAWVQHAAAANSTFSALKFSAFPMFNFVNHPHHGTDPAKYGVEAKPTES